MKMIHLNAVDHWDPTQAPRCECLYCDGYAVARFTAPKVRARTLMCAQCLSEQLPHAAPYRDIAGAVVIELIK
jgi:hypothetical protein